MVDETVEQRPGQALRAERLGPFVEGKIRGENGSALPVYASGTSACGTLSDRSRELVGERHCARGWDAQGLHSQRPPPVQPSAHSCRGRELLTHLVVAVRSVRHGANW